MRVTHGLLVLTGLLLIAATAGPASCCATPTLRLIQTIPLPGVEGRIDHFSIDLKRSHLLIASLGNNTLNVVNLRAGRVTDTIHGFRHPQGVGFAPESDRIFVANADDGVCAMLDAATLKRLGEIDFHDDADNVRSDPLRHEIVVGYGSGGLGFLDSRNGRLLGSVPLPAHPESFQLDSSGQRIFVNIPEAQEVAVVDRARRRVTASWRLSQAQANFPMALDEGHHRLFIGCRDPARLLVLDTASGRQVASLNIDGDTDDVYYDPVRKLVIASCGEGYVDTFIQQTADHYVGAGRVQTAPGARTSLWVPSDARLYVAVPHRTNQRAEVRVYAVRR